MINGMTELCQELRNWFDRKRHRGTFVIEGGTLTADFLKEDQYYRILGSVFNDGVHIYPSYSLKDETFEGEVWEMAVPPAVIELAENISAWEKKYGDVDSPAMTPFLSESFGGYAYTKGSSTSAGSGNTATGWRAMFGNDLNRWRKL